MPIADWGAMAATCAVAGLLQATSGFGFAVLAVPLFLLFTTPETAVQLVIIITLALSAAVLPGLHRAVRPPLLLRLAAGGLAGVPIGLWAFQYADPATMRVAVSGVVLGFALVLAVGRLRRRSDLIALHPAGDLAAGVVSGAASALTGMSGPPVLIYLMLAGTPPDTVRATLFAYFVLAYAATLLAHVATVGLAAGTWVIAAILIPFAWAGGLVGRRLGDRLPANAAAALAIALLGAAGIYTIATAIAIALS